MTYNHENYIRQCLDGFVDQNTTFLFEVLVHDDASTDDTAKIVKEFEVKYPELFRCVYQTENQFTKKNTLFSILLPMASGKYIALCEGDDYWTDPFKLQKQVDFLENHPGFSMSCHNIEVTGNAFQASYINNVKEFYTAKEIASGEIAISTLSIVFRNYKFTYPDFLSKTPVGDFPLFLLIAQYGRIKYFPEIMGVRRVHENGLWSAADKSTKLSYLLITLYYMIGNYNEEINDALIQYHLKLVANSIKEGVSTDLYPKEMNWIIEIMSRYSQFRKVLRNFGLFGPLKKVFGKLKD
jgi:glycosyltransferase involved in cell wall biosynthesis